MTFREILATVIDQTPGAQAGAIMASDGIPVDEYGEAEGVELGAMAVEFQPLLAQATKVSGALFEGREGLEEMILVTNGHQILFRPIDDEFFLAVALGPDALLGKARFLIRSLLQDLRETL